MQKARDTRDGPEALAFLERVRSLGFNAPAPLRATPSISRDRAAAEILELEDRCDSTASHVSSQFSFPWPA